MVALVDSILMEKHLNSVCSQLGNSNQLSSRYFEV